MTTISDKLIAVLLLTLPLDLLADWQLDAAASSVSFVSIKNEAIAETHHFRQLQGTVTAAGVAELSIDLASVDTGIEIRDQRLRELLFQVADHPHATITVQLDSALLADLHAHDPQFLTLPVQIALHGVRSQLSAELLLWQDNDGCVHVLSAQPVLLHAGDFGLVDGINALRDVAGLGSIATVVPVSVHLQFRAP